MSAVKRKLKTLTLAQKLEVLEAVKGGKKRKDISEQFGLPMSTLSSIVKNELEIMKKIETSHLSCKRQRILKFPDLDECLLKWFNQCRNQNINISGSMLKEKSEAYAKSLGLVNFKASNGWLDKFKKRHELAVKKACEEGEIYYNEVYDKWKNELQDLVCGYKPENIFNADETGLYFNCVPNKNQTSKNDEGHDEKHIKERLTILLATNMTGTEKLPPLVIGKAEKAHCFSKCKSLPLMYEENAKAQMTSKIFNNWLINFDMKMARENRNILLFIDSCAAHNKTPKMEAIKIQYLPANIVSQLQPMDQGIIKNFKSFYRKELVRNMLHNMEEEKSFSTDVLQAMRMVDKAWRNVHETTVKKCFTYCGFPVSSTEDPVIGDISIRSPAGSSTDVSETEMRFNFVPCDVEINTADTLSDEISNPVTIKIEREDLDDNATGTPVSINEARAALNTLRNFIEQTSNSEEKEFSALHTLENAIDKEYLYNLKQIKQ